MLTTLLKQFGLGKAVVEPVFHQRQINLSGNRISFAMPENFSHDFPAEEMIESVDLDKAAGISEYHGVTLLRRFWDFKTDGFFKKDIGTLVMVLSVKKVPEGCKKNLAHPLEFVEVLQEALQEYYEAFNKTAAAEFRMFYSASYNTFDEYIINKDRWLSYQHAREDDRESAIHYAIPVTKQHYIVVEFISLPADTVHMRSFIVNYTHDFINNIINTCDIRYAEGNSLVEDLQQHKVLRLEKIVEELTDQSIKEWQDLK